MATLKGQNLRVYAGQSVIGMATNCTITLTNNTDDASTKDDVGMASKPVTTSKSWQVQVESLNVSDVATMLTAIKNLTPFSLRWDEASTTDNQTGLVSTFARAGQAYITDATFNFNDREYSAKSLQFSGTGGISAVASGTTTTVLPAGSYTKGQFVRLFLSDDNTAAPSKVIAAAKTLALHVSVTVENATTKDTEGEWQIQEPTAISYATVQDQALADIETIYVTGTPVKWKIANVSGQNNRTASSTIVSGSAVLTQLTINAANRQNATYDAQLTGYGEYTVAA